MGSPEKKDKTTVKTYIPTYQKTEWQDHATELGMSQSEFIRTMVQAGRQSIEKGRQKDPSTHTNPRGYALEDRVLELLSTSSYTFDELIEELMTDLEDDLERTLDELKDDGHISQSARGTLKRIESGANDS